MGTEFSLDKRGFVPETLRVIAFASKSFFPSSILAFRATVIFSSDVSRTTGFNGRQKDYDFNEFARAS